MDMVSPRAGDDDTPVEADTTAKAARLLGVEFKSDVDKRE
jgi:hypothetical protein